LKTLVGSQTSRGRKRWQILCNMISPAVELASLIIINHNSDPISINMIPSFVSTGTGSSNERVQNSKGRASAGRWALFRYLQREHEPGDLNHV
jgi:hypothetical protein